MSKNALANLFWYRTILGAVLIYDCVQRLFFGLFFLTGDGPLPKAALAGQSLLGEYPIFSPHAFSDQPFFNSTLLVVQIILAGLFAAGIRTSVTGWLSWILLASMQQRNELILHGADSLLAISLLWVNLIELEVKTLKKTDGVWSVYFFFAHVVLTVFSAGLSKLNPVWLSGEALRALVLTDPVMRPWTRVTLEFPWLLKVGSYAALALELSSPAWAFVFAWNSKFRRSFVYVLIGFHVTIFLFMKVGNFSPLYIGAWLFFAGFSKGVSAELESQSGRGLAAVRTLAVFVFALAVLNFAVFGLGVSEFRPTAIRSLSRLTRIARVWRLFTIAKPLHHLDVYVLENGQPTHSPITGTPWTAATTRPLPVGERNIDMRWLIYLHNLRRPKYEHLYPYLASYVCKTKGAATYRLIEQTYPWLGNSPPTTKNLMEWNCP